ncbi:HAMP domain-containing protein [Mucilaginibacter rubeus]|uniref:histidine kinase n=1 Tax=Mucilaginibacter rubeus TaxID=2027860 RepID=A0AAE6MIF3_9SPHI|nr:ATP-binding protein [Mucilaginibacter rubeus]QEM04503.1 HAMP domain-containing protein [Mucilaginibacter rubeus]QTE46402.1 PAS domain-containing protein [Mucilaginibacter rubeus]QTE52999.1 PAS domain-containing protein [Mucilaginibacter rubeus]QTE58085.1 PAS domain-containing protein [Mucilaginibacter rubeus]QTE62454.1 PAS domain-containing protein [Mucilaginibacter rubeus]
MKLRTKYILFVVILHLLTLVLTYFIFNDNKIYFIISEVVVIISSVIAVQLYRQLIQPLKTLMQGVEAIKDKDFNVKFLSTGKHEVDALIDVYNQMMDELRTERTRQEQQHFFLEKLIHTSPTGIIILDFDDRVQQINPKALQVLGIDEKAVVGELIGELNHPIFKHIKALKSGQTEVVKLDGINSFKLQKSHFIDRGFSRHFIMLEDLTAEILAAEKKVYGKVIRMMAHEVNNTIGPVNSIMQSAMKTDQLWAGHDFDPIKDALQVAMDRNQNLNLFMRNFADLVKLPPANKQPVVLQKLLASVVKLMNIRAKEKNVALVLHLPEEPVNIMADEQQLEQAFINIVKNAIEAIDDQGSVTFTINLKEKKLVITDTGKGITAEQNANLFTPFFSTKKDGQGIGLTLVREIMLNHGFEFSLKTVADQQTEFVIYF